MQFEEETFAQDGQVEDIIAVDFSKLVTHHLYWQTLILTFLLLRCCRCMRINYARPSRFSDDDGKSNATTRRSLHRNAAYPPMTPQACVRENLHGSTFDFIWKEV